MRPYFIHRVDVAGADRRDETLARGLNIFKIAGSAELWIVLTVASSKPIAIRLLARFMTRSFSIGTGAFLRSAAFRLHMITIMCAALVERLSPLIALSGHERFALHTSASDPKRTSRLCPTMMTAPSRMLQWRRESGCPPTARLAAIDHKLKAGEALFRLGDKTAGFYEVISGRVRLVRVDRFGRETVLHMAGPAETLAEASLFSGQYHCDAIANTDATVRVYPKRQVLSAFEEDPKALKTFTAMLAHQVMDLRTRFSNATSDRHASA